jgi:uncharacterized protein
MKIELKSIFEKPEVEKTMELSFEKDRLDGFQVSDRGSTSLSIKPLGKGRYRLAGSGSVKLLIPCARCLSLVLTEVAYDFSYDCSRESGTDEDGEQLPFLQDEDTIDTDLLISSELTQAIPMRVLCREDCKGVCPVCGKDLNEGNCLCGKRSAPTRFADAIAKALQESAETRRK